MLLSMLLSYIFVPSVVKCGILSNNMCSTLHAVIDCLFFVVVFFFVDDYGGTMLQCAAYAGAAWVL